MANRSYLFAISHPPASHDDRPLTVSGLSEWAYELPFLYRLLASGDPRLCASLISDTLDGAAVPLHAIASPFEPGLARVQRFADIVKTLPGAQPPPPPPTSVLGKIKSLFGPAEPTGDAARALGDRLDDMLAFLRAHRDRYVLLETLELDVMAEGEPQALKARVEDEIERCRQAGAALDALPADIDQAARVLQAATTHKGEAPLDAFFGLRLDRACDGTPARMADYSLGMYWSDVLYYDLAGGLPDEAGQGVPG